MIARVTKLDTIGEQLVLPIAINFSEIVNEQEYSDELKKFRFQIIEE